MSSPLIFEFPDDGSNRSAVSMISSRLSARHMSSKNGIGFLVKDSNNTVLDALAEQSSMTTENLEVWVRHLALGFKVHIVLEEGQEFFNMVWCVGYRGDKFIIFFNNTVRIANRQQVMAHCALYGNLAWVNEMKVLTHTLVFNDLVEKLVENMPAKIDDLKELVASHVAGGERSLWRMVREW